jgi:hemerythrin
LSTPRYRTTIRRQFAPPFLAARFLRKFKAGNTDYEEHCAAHRNILVKADSVLGESLQNSTRDDVALFFRDWLVHHIQGDDQSYAQHILSGAKTPIPDVREAAS